MQYDHNDANDHRTLIQSLSGRIKNHIQEDVDDKIGTALRRVLHDQKITVEQALSDARQRNEQIQAQVDRLILQNRMDTEQSRLESDRLRLEVARLKRNHDELLQKQILEVPDKAAEGRETEDDKTVAMLTDLLEEALSLGEAHLHARRRWETRAHELTDQVARQAMEIDVYKNGLTNALELAERLLPKQMPQ